LIDQIAKWEPEVRSVIVALKIMYCDVFKMKAWSHRQQRSHGERSILLAFSSSQHSGSS